MRLVALAVLASFSSSLVSARKFDIRQINDLPECSKSCVTDNFQGCNNLDIGCICGKTSLISDLSCCVSKSCNAADQEFTIQFAQKLCSTYQITLPTVAGCTGAAASATGGAAASAASSAASAASGSKTTASAAASNTNAASHQSIGSAVGVCAAMAGLVAML